MTDHLILTDNASAVLGMTKDEVAAMTLGKFFELALGCGRDIRVSGFNACAEAGNLTITTEPPTRPVASTTGF